MTRTRLSVVALLSAGWLAAAGPAQAADPTVEIGASLVGITASVDDDGGALLVIPSGGPIPATGGLYASFFLGPHVAIEPQLSLFWAGDGDHSSHTVAFAGQVSYFLKPASGPSVYLFGSAGTTDSSDRGDNPELYSVGAGYRVPVGDTLAVRMDGRYTRIQFDGGGDNLIAFTISIGGIFGRK